MHPSDGRVVSNFIVQALRNEDITVYGDGSQTRSFCYVDDLVDGLMRLMETPDEITGPVNLGNPVEFTVGRSSSSPDRNRKSSFGRYPKTIRGSAARTSTWPGSCSIGSPACSCAKA
jgi:hypothetical protein